MDGVHVDEAVAFFIAKHIPLNVRELEGALKRVLAYARFNNTVVNVTTAREALKDLLAAAHGAGFDRQYPRRRWADYFKIKVSDMYSKKRFRSVARPRQVAMALAKELTQQSLPEIGEAFGGRDHTDRAARLSKVQGISRYRPGFLAWLRATFQQILLGEARNARGKPVDGFRAPPTQSYPQAPGCSRSVRHHRETCANY